jgi:hypothetical protein
MEKAVIRTVQGEDPEVVITCLFNPNEYTFRKTNRWTANETAGEDIPDIQFGGGDSATLTKQLFLDTSTTGGDVRDVVDQVRTLMEVNPDLTGHSSVQGRPPFVEFQWGQTWSFKAVITSVTEHFTLFRDDGVPIRATLDIEFLQGEIRNENQTRAQNPTTVGKPGYRHWIVSEGDTIDWIAFTEYGDASKWRYIADINNLDAPDRLRPGQALAIAPLP